MEKTQVLPENFKKKWVDALRSGKYKQSKRRLYATDKNSGEVSYCCLGVAAHIVAGIQLEHMDWCMLSTILHGHEKVVPDELAPFFSDSTTQHKLAQLNDVEDKSFGEIADYIEQNL